MNQDKDNEDLLLVFLAILALPFLIGALPALFAPVEEWLVSHQVLVTAAVVWQPPGLESGLDVPRLVILAALALAGLAGLFRVTRRRKRAVR